MLIAGYRGVMRWMRPCYNAWAHLRSLPRLPRPSEPVRYLTAALTLVADDDPVVFRQLLDFLIRSRSGGSVGVSACRDARIRSVNGVAARVPGEPGTPRTSIWYVGRMEMRCGSALDSRPVYLELGSL